MSIYRPTPISQRDGSEFANVNCRMSGIATGIDYHTLGAITSTGAEMRSRQSDQEGGTDSGDSAEAWRTYGQELLIRDGLTFDDALADLRAGRALQLDVWHATTGGPCLSGSGAYAHDLAIAPEQSGTRWLVADPWCSPARWEWWEELLLRAGAEKLGSQVFTAATAGHAWAGSETELVSRMQRALRAISTRYRPEAPAMVEPRDVGGAGGRILYTATRAHSPAESEERDMAINAASGLVTEWHAAIAAGVAFYADAKLTERLGEMVSDARVVYVGQPIGELGEGGSRAILVNTRTAYDDDTARPTIVYVAADAIVPEQDP